MSNDVNALTEQGQQAINGAHYTKAVILYTQLLALDSESVTAYANRGFARYATGDSEGAIEDYEEALKRSPDLPAVLNNRGLAKTALGDLDGAQKDFNQILESDPEHAVAFNNRGHVWIKLAERDYQRAEEIFSKLGLTDSNAVFTREDRDDVEHPTFRVEKLDPERLVSSYVPVDRSDNSRGGAAREASGGGGKREGSAGDHVMWAEGHAVTGAVGGFVRGLMVGGPAGAVAGIGPGAAAGVAVGCVSCHISRSKPREFP